MRELTAARVRPAKRRISWLGGVLLTLDILAVAAFGFAAVKNPARVSFKTVEKAEQRKPRSEPKEEGEAANLREKYCTGTAAPESAEDRKKSTQELIDSRDKDALIRRYC